MTRYVHAIKLGSLNYGSSLKLQNHVVQYIKNGSNNDIHGILLIVEHNPVYTVGIRQGKYGSDLEQNLTSLGAEFFRTNRGGLITFHGPGQLVAYPVLNLKYFRCSVRWYIDQLESTVINTCRDYGIKGTTSPHTGVWVNDRKICAIGIHASRYVTSHGLALNCNTDLDWFQHIVPCEIEGKGVTSLTVECAKDIAVDEVVPAFLNNFCQVFGCRILEADRDFANKCMEYANNDDVKAD